MYARSAVKPRPRTSKPQIWPAPIGGWIANRNLAQPSQPGAPQGAAILDNWFPTSTTAVLRRGKELYATLGAGVLDVTSLFSYVVGTQEKLFAATSSTIYDITTIATPFNWTLGTGTDTIVTDLGDTFGADSTTGKEVYTGLTGGDWVVVQFSITGGTYSIGVNGEDVGFIYDGVNFYPNVPNGIWKLDYNTGTVLFPVGATITGGTSGATATVVKTVGTAASGSLWLKSVTGTFAAAENITGSPSGSAKAVSAQTSLAPGVAFPGGFSLTTADLSFVWAYKNRLFFVQKDTLDTWYLAVDAIGGTLTRLPMGGNFQRGGSLLFGASWSLDSGASGGLSEQCIFATTEGEVAVFQGNNPADAAAWSRVGVYRIGKPLGNKAFIKAGGDVVIASSIGFVPLSQAIQRDYAALSPSAVSYPIEDAWNEATTLRGLTGWNCIVWPENQMVCVSPPTSGDSQPVLFVANARSGAWARFTNWHAKAMEVFKGQLYFGGPEGKVYAANVSGLDDGITFTGVYLPLFEDLGSSASLKIGELGWVAIRAKAKVNAKVTLRTDFDLSVPSPPDSSVAGTGNEWGVAIWGQSIWGAQVANVISQDWQSISGSGYAIALAVQVTSGSVVPTDAELIRSGITYQQAEIIT